MSGHVFLIYGDMIFGKQNKLLFSKSVVERGSHSQDPSSKVARGALFAAELPTQFEHGVAKHPTSGFTLDYLIAILILTSIPIPPPPYPPTHTQLQQFNKESRL
jgi:hypothetical protein